MIPTHERPTLLVIAGPNGSGKTTLRQGLEASGIALPHHIDPDQIAATIEGDAQERSRAAQRVADDRRTRFLSERRSFSFETVLSHPSKIAFMRAARAAGYLVILYFVATADPLVNIARVADRVAKGGHDVPEDRVRARYERSLGLLATAAREADRVYVFDNSGCGDERRLCAAIEDGTLRVLARPLPGWVLLHFVAPLTARPAAMAAP